MELLQGVIRDYDWGDERALSEILGHPAPGHPEAEYWLGAHPSAPSVIGSTGATLDKLVVDRPDELLGADVAARFGGLPFLLKILAAAKPLSIQAHPSLAQAEAGFAREDAAGLDRSAPDRNYRDPNHKPELICALTPFEGKCGFRDVATTRELLALLAPVLDPLSGWLDGPTEAEALATAVARLLRLPSSEAGALADATAARAAELLADDGSSPAVARFEAELAWTVKIGEAFPADIGLVVALLLNHVVLAPGEAIFLPAGNLHAYLRGVGVELMANSDNVLRGGLTPKHVDVDELLSVVSWVPSAAPVQRPEGAIHRFEVPVPEFGLVRLDASAGSIEIDIEPCGPEIVLVTDGAVSLEAGGDRLDVDAGQAAFVGPGDGRVRLSDRAPGRTRAWRATTGEQPIA